ncbi:MAG: hypothetical protein F6K41_39530 [Symploca sp. SIO3E6]|nr:hypothetical protein [Caldora sp. SIO3E6]
MCFQQEFTDASPNLESSDCSFPIGAEGTLVRFRAALIAGEGDRRLVERTIEIVEKKGGFSSITLRAALDSSPLWGAAKVEDTYNLLGHALRKALEVIAHQQGENLDIIASQSGASLIADSSLKAALDLNWDDLHAQNPDLLKKSGFSKSCLLSIIWG